LTSATTEPARRTHGRRVEGQGLIVFASVLLVIIARRQDRGRPRGAAAVFLIGAPILS
jgi:hypothetical protein